MADQAVEHAQPEDLPPKAAPAEPDRPAPGEDPELARDRGHVAALYARLDEQRAEMSQGLARVRRSRPGGSPQNRSERDAYAAWYADRLARLEAVEERLVFGRLDLVDGARRYIGRLALSDAEHRPLLMDWRAPASEPFYRATAANPGEVVRRRHLITTGRELTGVEDEILDLTAVRDAAPAAGTVHGEAALLAAVNAQRTGRMGDIVATIQAEQDRVIRAGLPGVLVVAGGPGTGKTAVALHRAAYLLYTHRDRLERRGVLLVGPTDVFLRYISKVLPSLGETGVVTTTPGRLFPGVDAREHDTDAVAAVKGDLRMVRVLRTAVRDRQRVPDRALPLQVEGRTVLLQPGMVAAARSTARSTRRPHNGAREVFVTTLLRHLAGAYADARGIARDLQDPAEADADLRASRDVRREVNLAWMPLTPQQVLTDLYANPDALTAAGQGLSARERALLARERDAAWTVDDVPLLDELAEILGVDDTAARAAAKRRSAEQQAERDYAATVLRSVGGQAAAMIGADSLADRFAGGGDDRTVAERAADDRTWAFGHVVVDEAQELSAMAWRALHRRCPSRSMTLVGDLSQTSSAAGAGTWAQVLDPWAEGRWRLALLSVNYRTPAQIMDLAVRVLVANSPPDAVVRTPSSVRIGTAAPVIRAISSVDDVVATVVAETARLAGGRLAVVCPRHEHAAVSAAVTTALPGRAGSGPTALDLPVAVLTADQVKGLEFDSVILIEPADVLAGSRRGANDLYVAMTRPTQRLIVLHQHGLPRGFDPAGGEQGPPPGAGTIARPARP